MAKSLFKIESEGDDIHLKTEGSKRQMIKSISVAMKGDPVIARIVTLAVMYHLEEEFEITEIEKVQ